MQFRKDINGLRALAVLIVLFYHFHVKGFRTGFIGVDIFFVISGFLMTSIILNGLNNNTFDFYQFYKARIKRLYPALLVVCLTTFLAIFFLLSPSELLYYTKNALSTLSFISNIYYQLNSGYFDVNSNENWLLHTWSLSVEWQFYLLYPFILFLLNRFKFNIKFSLIFLFILSLILSVYWGINNSTLGFYSLGSRYWELVLGGIIFLILKDNQKFSEKIRKFLFYLGLICIALSGLLFTAKTPWPSYFAVLPVLGSGLVIFANVKSILLDNKIAQELGKISYSVYLWHWPIVVFMYKTERLESVIFTILGILLSLFFGYLSYKFIEIQFKKKLNFKLLFIFLVSILLVLSTAFVSKGFRFRLDPRINQIASYQMNWNYERCFLNENTNSDGFKNCRSKPTDDYILVWGDSYADHLLPGLIKYLPNKTIVSRTASGCPPIIDIDISNRVYCREINNYIQKMVVEKTPKIVILSAAWFSYQNDNLLNTIKFLNSNKIEEIYIIGISPMWKKYINKYIEEFGNTAIPRLSKKYLRPNIFDKDFQLTKLLENSQLTYRYISVLDVLCDTKSCLSVVEKEGKLYPVSWDSGHFSIEASEYLIEKIKKQINTN